MKKIRCVFLQLNRILCTSIVLIIGNFLLCGYSGNVSTPVILDGTDLGTLVDIEAIYTGELVATNYLNKDDFAVYGLYTFGGSEDKQKFGPVSSDDFTIDKSVLAPGKNEITVSYKGFTTKVQIECTKRGYITIIATGLDVDATETDVKQDKDEDLLNKGNNITYAFVKNKIDNVSDVIENKIENEIFASVNKVQIVSVYDITLNRETNSKQESVEKLNSPVRLIIPIDKHHQKENRSFFVLKNHDGVIQKLEDLDNDPKTVTIETESFSEYALLYEDNVKKENIGVSITSEYRGSTLVGTKLTKDMFQSKAVINTSWEDGTNETVTKQIEVNRIDKDEVKSGKNEVLVTSSYQGKEYQSAVVIYGTSKGDSGSTNNGEEKNPVDRPDKNENNSSVSNDATSFIEINNADQNAMPEQIENRNLNSAQTGDGIAINIWFFIFIVSATVCFVAYKKVRKK